MKLQATKNDIPEATRQKVVALLNEHLGTAIDLALQAKQAHWNVKGPHFLQLHQLFDKLRDEADEWSDSLAERAAQLGGTAEGTLQSVGERTKLPAYRVDISAGHDHVEAISKSLATFGKGVRQAIDTTTELKDAGTADLFTEISRESDYMLWFVEAHIAR